jgi:hypothetical protein
MSLITNKVVAPNISALETIIAQQSSQIQQLTNLYSSQNEREFDQVTKQDAIISYDETTKKYRFEIQKPENDIYVYQIWKKNNTQLNNDRKYYYEKLGSWIDMFKISNRNLGFTPTTLIEIDKEEKDNSGNTIIKEHFYPSVLVDADREIRNGVEYCVMYYENKTISPLQGIVLEEMPKSGFFSGVRFDIDAGTPNIKEELYGKYLKADRSSDLIFNLSPNGVSIEGWDNSYYIKDMVNVDQYVIITIKRRNHSIERRYKLISYEHVIREIHVLHDGIKDEIPWIRDDQPIVINDPNCVVM